MEQRWERRRGLAVGVRTLAWAVPLAGSVGSAVLVATVFPPPDGAAAAVWWVGLVGWSLLVLAAIGIALVTARLRDQTPKKQGSFHYRNF